MEGNGTQGSQPHQGGSRGAPGDSVRDQWGHVNPQTHGVEAASNRGGKSETKKAQSGWPQKMGGADGVPNVTKDKCAGPWGFPGKSQASKILPHVLRRRGLARPLQERPCCPPLCGQPADTSSSPSFRVRPNCGQPPHPRLSTTVTGCATWHL
jgi:hypothetical protein